MAQPLDALPPVYLAVVSGDASVERDGRVQPALLNMPLIPGDRLRTSTGRVELLFPDGGVIDVDVMSVAELQSLTLVRLSEGRVLLTVAGAENPALATRYRIDTPAASALTEGPGEFRVTTVSGPNGAQAELAVRRGFAALITERDTMPVRAGERTVIVEGEPPSPPGVFNSARVDEFDRWSADNRDQRVITDSAQYLPQDLQVYGSSLDESGAWSYLAPYGYVWYPAATAGWRPYYYGHWTCLPRYGWTWVGNERWTWPTHHYGRWGYSNGWYWIPGSKWSPAWVSWASSARYVTWSPLGADGHAVFGLSANIVNPWAGWVAVPRSSFAAGDAYAPHYAVPPSQLPPVTTFVAGQVAPLPAPRPARHGSGGSARSSGSQGGSATVVVPGTVAPMPARAHQPAGALQNAKPQAAAPVTTAPPGPPAVIIWRGTSASTAPTQAPAPTATIHATPPHIEPIAAPHAASTSSAPPARPASAPPSAAPAHGPTASWERPGGGLANSPMTARPAASAPAPANASGPGAGGGGATTPASGGHTAPPAKGGSVGARPAGRPR